MIKLTPKQFFQQLGDLFKLSDRNVEKLIQKGDTAFESGQLLFAASCYVDAYGMFTRMHDPGVVAFQLALAKKLVETYSEIGDSVEINFWKETVVELQRSM